ncbi:hypothetical protein LguiB_031817 [Lonicera macranthoides]
MCRHEGQLVKKVVQDVLLGLKKNYTQLPDNLVGLDDHIKSMKELLNVDSNGIRVVGIHGIGGLGKTTIAKVIYNQLCEGFECCCFIEDVRANSEGQNGIVNLQAHLLCKIQKREIARINNVDEGIKQIKDAVGMKKVIIVLDDVDDIYQFDMLVGKCNWFGAGSRIIVTTRNKGLLDTIEATYEIENLHDVYGSYEPHLMESIHSLQLFSKYAFMRDSPPEDYGSLAQKVVTRDVEALNLNLRNESECQPQCLVGKDFKKLRNLRYLSLGWVDLDGDFKQSLSNLKWLDWQCSGNFWPINCHLKNLVVLNLFAVNIPDNWKGWSEIKVS